MRRGLAQSLDLDASLDSLAIDQGLSVLPLTLTATLAIAKPLASTLHFKERPTLSVPEIEIFAAALMLDVVLALFPNSKEQVSALASVPSESVDLAKKRAGVQAALGPQ